MYFSGRHLSFQSFESIANGYALVVILDGFVCQTEKYFSQKLLYLSSNPIMQTITINCTLQRPIFFDFISDISYREIYRDSAEIVSSGDNVRSKVNEKWEVSNRPTWSLHGYGRLFESSSRCCSVLFFLPHHVVPSCSRTFIISMHRYIVGISS